MDHATHNKIVSFIRSIPDDCLRNGFGANVAGIIDSRFEVNLPDTSGKRYTVLAAPAVDAGQLLCLMGVGTKAKRLQDSLLGGRIASVHNGSALFTGNASGGASNILNTSSRTTCWSEF